VSVPRRRRLGLIALVIVAAAGCLTLGWWQWNRWESTSGSFQNLGYALQWPLFAGFCVYAYRKFIQLEEHPPEAHDTVEPSELPEGLLPERPASANRSQDPVLREYNTYLAELAEKDLKDLKDKDKRTTA
jgi:DNA-binding transcriptional regulator of glucitol operon